MTTEDLLEQIKALPELELKSLVEGIHEHCERNDMEHVFNDLIDDSEQVEELKSRLIVATTMIARMRQILSL